MTFPNHNFNHKLSKLYFNSSTSQNYIFTLNFMKSQNGPKIAQKLYKDP